MSKLQVQAFGPQGLRGFNETANLPKAEIKEILARVPEDAKRWIDWTDAVIVIRTGRGRTAKTIVSPSLTSLTAVEEYVANTLQEL